MGNTSGQGTQFSKGLKRDYSFLQETGGKVWSVEAGGSCLFQKGGGQETSETQRASDGGMPFVSEADPNQQETPQRIYFYSHDQKGNGSEVGEKLPFSSPNTERQGIGQSEVWTTLLKKSGEGLYDLFYETTADPHDRAKGRIQEFLLDHPMASGIGMECPTLPLCL